MDEPRDYHAKWSKSEKDKSYALIQYMSKYKIHIICEILKSDTNELIFKTEIYWQL